MTARTVSETLGMLLYWKCHKIVEDVCIDINVFKDLFNKMCDNTKAFRTIIVGEQRRLAKKLVGISEAKPWSFDLAYWFPSQG